MKVTTGPCGVILCVSEKMAFIWRINMKKAVILTMLFSLIVLQGCSEFLARQKEERRSAVYTKLVIGTPRSEIIEIIGEPKEKEDEFIEVYELCMPKGGHERGLNIVIDVATLFLWEIIATPYELTTPCEWKSDIVIIYDDEHKVLAYMSKAYYEEVKTVNAALIQRIDELEADPNMLFLGYVDGAGWIFVDKTRIFCIPDKNIVRVDAETVLDLHRALQYRFILKSKTVPVIAKETVILDMKKRELGELSSSLYNQRGRDLGPTTEEDWADLFALKKKDDFLNTFSRYCNTKELESVKRVRIPSIRQYFAERIRQTEQAIQETPYR